jgi:hypothetical protein
MLLSHRDILNECFKNDLDLIAGLQWLAPVILAIQGAEIRRIEVRSQPLQLVLETLC